MRKSQINIFLILGILLVIVFSLVIYATSKVNEKGTADAVEAAALSPGLVTPLRMYVENLLYTLTEEALFTKVGGAAVIHNPLPTQEEMAQMVSNHITSNFDSSLTELSQFEKDGMEITKGNLIADDVEVNINPTDVTVTTNSSWTVKTGSIRNTIPSFKTILFVRIGVVDSIAEYLNPKTGFIVPYQITQEDCNYIMGLGGQHTDGTDYITVSATGGTVTITDAYTEKFYFQKPFVFKFAKSYITGNCPPP